MEQLILIAFVLVSAAMVGLILLQQGKGADMGASFGSGGIFLAIICQENCFEIWRLTVHLLNCKLGSFFNEGVRTSIHHTA